MWAHLYLFISLHKYDCTWKWYQIKLIFSELQGVLGIGSMVLSTYIGGINFINQFWLREDVVWYLPLNKPRKGIFAHIWNEWLVNWKLHTLCVYEAYTSSNEFTWERELLLVSLQYTFVPFHTGSLESYFLVIDWILVANDLLISCSTLLIRKNRLIHHSSLFFGFFTWYGGMIMVMSTS